MGSIVLEDLLVLTLCDDQAALVLLCSLVLAAGGPRFLFFALLTPHPRHAVFTIGYFILGADGVVRTTKVSRMMVTEAGAEMER